MAVLCFIRQSRTLGFSTRQIGELLALRADGARRSQDVKALARRHLADLERKLGELAQMKAELGSGTTAPPAQLEGGEAQ